VRTNVLFKSNRNVVYSCKYHVVWCPKYRRPVLVDDVGARLKEILHQTTEELGSEIIELEIMPEHVHLLCDTDPQFGIRRLIKHLKGRGSRLLRQQFPCLSHLPSLWTSCEHWLKLFRSGWLRVWHIRSDQTIAQMEDICESKGTIVCGSGSVKWFRLRRKRQIAEVVERMSRLF
jgi:putative transposase